ncbi:hypothetical protein O7627_20515 [Solwaraspora sp. WMMD1047]|uniref:hypothetical protein n=1 Tax=Solwaraspora sp. WMMD1047 TaxID=3016102 RepID=UPI0024160807|nr:hypothetical protein [Solwaraspora sp. WMMD1047]MDG4831668.1 hypothetical protein [Solwaraspora sp. WMMD1047]
MHGDRLVAALERYVLRSPHERISARRDWPDGITVGTNWGWYDIEPVGWLIARESWVDEAVRVIRSTPIEDVMLESYGLVLNRDGSVLYVNDLAAMRDLGRRLGGDLNPLAYAELLAEFYSGAKIDGPIVSAPTVSERTPSGWLVCDVAATLANHPQLAPVEPKPPRVTDELSFDSCHYYFNPAGIGSAIDVRRWLVSGAEDEGVSWRRERLAGRVSGGR